MTAAGARMCFRTMAFGCCEVSPLEARLLPMKGVIVHKHHHTGNWTRTKPKFLVPFSCRTLAVGGSPLHNDYDIQLSRNFRETTFYFRELEKKTFARVSNITCTAFAIKTPYAHLFMHNIATILVGSQVKRSKTTPIAEIRKMGTSCTGFCWFWLPIQTHLSHIHIAIMSYDAPSNPNRFAPNCPRATRRIECGIWVGSIFRFVILFSFHGCSRYPLSHHKNAYFLIALDAPCLTHATYTSDLELNHSTHSTRKQMSAEAQHGVIWLYHGSGHLWAAPHSERDLALLAVVHRPLAMECLDVGSLGELKYSWFLLVLVGSC